MASNWVRVVLAMGLFLAPGCGGGDGDGTDQGTVDDGGARDQATQDGSSGDQGTDSDVPSVTPSLSELVLETPLLSGTAITTSVLGSGLTASCVLRLDMGVRSTVVPTTFVNADTLAAAIPVSATTDLYGYATLRVDDCPGQSAPLPIFVGAPTTTWNGPRIITVSPPTGPAGTVLAVGGTFVSSLTIERSPLTDLAVTAGSVTVPADWENGPMRFFHNGISPHTFVRAPFYTTASIAGSATVTASSSYTGNPVAYIADNSLNSVWYPDTGNCTDSECTNTNVWVQLDWASAVSIGTVAFRDRPSTETYRIHRMRIEAFNSPGSSTPFASRIVRLPFGDNNADYAFDPPLTGVRALRVVITQDDTEYWGVSNTASITELLVLPP